MDVVFYAKDRRFIPQYAHEGDAGLDMRSTESITLMAGETATINAGFSVNMPTSLVGLVCSRSGLSIKGLIVKNAPGIIDSSFKGDVCVILHNVSKKEFVIDVFDRIAQLVFVPVVTINPVAVVKQEKCVANVVYNHYVVGNITPQNAHEFETASESVNCQISPKSVRGSGGFGSSGIK